MARYMTKTNNLNDFFKKHDTIKHDAVINKASELFKLDKNVIEKQYIEWRYKYVRGYIN